MKGEVCFRYVPEKVWWDMGVLLYAPCRRRRYSAPALTLLLEHAFDVRGVENGFACLMLTKSEFKEKFKTQEVY